jgi:hypothetical protein
LWEAGRTDEKKRFNHQEIAMTDRDKRKAYEEKFDAQLKEWSAEIALLKAKADKAKAEAKIEYYKTIETLQARQNAARTKLQELKTAGDDVWEDIKTGTENIWAEVKAAFQNAASRFK